MAAAVHPSKVKEEQLRRAAGKWRGLRVGPWGSGGSGHESIRWAAWLGALGLAHGTKDHVLLEVTLREPRCPFIRAEPRRRGGQVVVASVIPQVGFVCAVKSCHNGQQCGGLCLCTLR